MPADQNFVPDSQFKPDESVASAGPSAAPAPAFIPDHQFVPDEEKYGTPGQMALTAAEGGAKGLLGPIATGGERVLSEAGIAGLSPEEQTRRQEVNPWIHGGSEVAGLGLGAVSGAGEGALLEIAGEGALKAAGLVGAKTLGAKASALALKGAIETSLFQTGDELSQRINDPSMAISSAIPHIGLSALIGAGGGLALGAVSPLWQKAFGSSVEQGIQDFKNSMEGDVTDAIAQGPVKQIEESGLTGRLRKQKSNAAELTDIASENDLPLPQGITSDSKEIQQAEDSLLNGPPTVPSIARRKIYQQGYDKASQLVDQAVSPGATEISETQAGNALKQSLTSKLEAENAPIKSLYDEIQPYKEAIPVSERSTQALGRTIRKIIDDEGLIQGTPEHNFVGTMADGIGQVDNLDKLANFRTALGRATGPETKFISGLVREKLDGVEERAIQRFAGGMKTPEAQEKITSLLDQVSEAKSKYAAFRDKLQGLGNALGKKKIYGPQDFIDFVDEMNPQTLARRLFNENNTEFAQKFAESFPEEMQIMRGYQRGLVRESASPGGAFNAKAAIKKVMGMEPEAQKLIFSPEEVQTIQNMDTYLRAFPKSFNPSGTAHETAFRAFFEHPTGAALANLRDYGIQSFIKAFGSSASGSESQAGSILPVLGNAVSSKETNTGAFKHAVEYSMAVIRGEKAIGRSVKSIFNASIPVAATQYPDSEKIEKLDKRLKDFQTNPDLYSSIGGEMGHYLPNQDIALKGAAANAINYLNGLRPIVPKTAPLDPPLEPSEEAKSRFNRALAIAENPLSVIHLLKEKMLTSEDMGHLKALYPGLVQNLAQKVTEQMTSHVSKEKPIPYEIKFGLSTLLGQPMDSGMSPQAVAQNQSVFDQSNAQQQAQNTPKSSTTSQVGMREMKPSNRISLDSSRGDEA